VPTQVNAQIEIIIQLETDSELEITELGNALEFMAQAECDSSASVNLEFIEAVTVQFESDSTSSSSAFFISRSLERFPGESLNAAGVRVVTVPSGGNDA
jgi:hypothetical protein